MQALFLDWAPHDTEVFSNRYIDPYDLHYMRDFQTDIETQYEPSLLLERVAANMKTLEQVAAAIFRLISSQVNGTPHNMKVDPYSISLHSGPFVHPVEIEKEENIDAGVSRDVDKTWFYAKKEPV
jgi:hypothetical protein